MWQSCNSLFFDNQSLNFMPLPKSSNNFWVIEDGVISREKDEHFHLIPLFESWWRAKKAEVTLNISNVYWKIAIEKNKGLVIWNMATLAWAPYQVCDYIVLHYVFIMSFWILQSIHKKLPQHWGTIIDSSVTGKGTGARGGGELMECSSSSHNNSSEDESNMNRFYMDYYFLLFCPKKNFVP